MKSPLMDSIIHKLESSDAASSDYRNLEEAALRLLSVNVPYILIGEKITKTIYAEKGLCLPPVATWRMLEAAYLNPTGSCP